MRINDDNKLDLCDTMITIVYESGSHTENIKGFEITKYEFGAEVIYHDGQYDKPITLADIRRKYPKVHLVISEHALEGKVFRYGNHGVFWEQIGTTEGYA